MPVFKPFKAYRPAAKNAEQLASRPFDVVRQAEADSENEKGLSQFLKVTKPEMFQQGLSPEQCHKQSRIALNEFIENSLLVQDAKECFYLYGQTLGDRTQYGVIGCLSADDYKNGLIKQHELTRVEKVSDRANHILETGFHTEPVFTAIQDNIDFDLIIQDCLFLEPEYNFVTSDGVTHQFWVIDNDAKIRRIQHVMANDIAAVYIADGHHRSAAASIVANESDSQSYSLFPAAVFPMKQLKLKGYHRLVNLAGISPSELLDTLKLTFSVLDTNDKPVFPKDQRGFGLLLENKWYKLSFSQFPEGVSEAASVFNHLIAEAIFGIDNIRTTDRIEYFGNKNAIDNIIDNPGAISDKAFFTLCPLDMSMLFNLSDQGYILPPKSTWFEPKLRSGLFLHSLND